MMEQRARRVSGLFVHPIKSAAAIAVDVMDLDDRGAVADRRWLVVSGDGLQITARETPVMALVRPRFAIGAGTHGPRRNSDGALLLDAPEMPTFRLELPGTSATRLVRVWADTVEAHDAGDLAAEWMSDAIRQSCRVVRLAEHARRPLRAKYAGPLPFTDRRVAFSDGAPLLLLGQRSVDALSERLVEQGDDAMTIARFRPNVLLSGTDAHEEDTWERVEIGSVSFGVGSPCSRCVMTTVNPDTAEKGIEPLRTLATYRRQDGEVMFGMNATHASPGTLYLDDRVTVTATR